METEGRESRAAKENVQTDRSLSEKVPLKRGSEGGDLEGRRSRPSGQLMRKERSFRRERAGESQTAVGVVEHRAVGGKR